MERNGEEQRLLPEVRRVKGQALQLPFKENEQGKHFGRKWQELLKEYSRISKKVSESKKLENEVFGKTENIVVYPNLEPDFNPDEI